MSAYENLPVYKKALDLARYFDDVVSHFAKRHKHTIGAKLVNLSCDVLLLIAAANKKAERLHLQLHPRRQKLQPISNGVDFLGYIIRPTYILVRRRVINNLKAKIEELKNIPNKLKDSVASYCGHLKWANSHRLTQKIFKEQIWLVPGR